MPSTPPPQPFCLALITFSAPWAGNPTSGLYNLRQVQALRRAGVDAEIIVCGLRFPRAIQKLRPGLRRLSDRPSEWTFEGVPCRLVTGMFPHPNRVRWSLAPRFPHVAEALVRSAFGRALAAELDRFNPNAIYAHDGVMFGALTAALARARTIPFGLIEHDTINWDLSTAMGRRYAAIASQAAAVFGVGLPSVWGLTHNLGLPNARFSPNGVAMATDAQLRTPRPPEYAGKRIALAAGSPVPSKGHRDLVRAFAAANVPDSLLLLVSIDIEPEVRSLIRDLNLGDRFRHLHPMPQEDLQQLMVWADVFAMPSRMESFGMVYAEALAAGTPVILTRSCGIAPHLTHGDHGWIVPPGDPAALTEAMREALTTPKPPDLVATGRRLVGETFTWDMSARAILAGLQGEPPPSILIPPHADPDAMRAALPMDVPGGSG